MVKWRIWGKSMKFTISHNVGETIHKAHRAYEWKFTAYLKMWDFYSKIRPILTKRNVVLEHL